MVFGTFPMLKECCCGCSLNTGSMIIGYISLISTLILAGVTSTNIYNAEHSSKIGFIETAIQISIVVVNILIAIASLLLIIGTHRRQSGYIIPWLVAAIITVPVDCVSLGIMLGKLAIGVFNPKVYALFSHVSITIYFFFVVFSYYREIKNQAPRHCQKA
uniref:G-protein coupled receptors family 1 profile domain-containing protein n=1 Tax=Clastoptera arizonana TaxID=38151 RepID=A0A1B6CXA8_9HEMI